MRKNSQIRCNEVELVYAELKSNLGFYRAIPGQEPYICLSEKLLEGSQGVHLNVFQMLLNYHRSIPLDSCFRLFEITRYFEELIPVPAQEPVAVKSPHEIEVFARAYRQWRYVYKPDGYNLVGRE